MGTANRIMFVCTKASLITNALLNKIKLRGADPFYVHEAQQLDGDAGTAVYYMEDGLEGRAALHGALDAFCARHGARLVCVGSKEQYEIFLRDFAAERVAGFFERPLDMERFLDCVVAAPDTAARKKRVLIVDDDANYRQFVRDWLRERYDVSMANGGEQALKVLAAQKCDLVLLDYEMPDVSGPETMERIRALPAPERPSVIFLTGNEEEARIRQALSLRPAGCLTKTVSREQLLSKVAEVLAGA